MEDKYLYTLFTLGSFKNQFLLIIFPFNLSIASICIFSLWAHLWIATLLEPEIL